MKINYFSKFSRYHRRALPLRSTNAGACDWHVFDEDNGMSVDFNALRLADPGLLSAQREALKTQIEIFQEGSRANNVSNMLRFALDVCSKPEMYDDTNVCVHDDKRDVEPDLAKLKREMVRRCAEITFRLLGPLSDVDDLTTVIAPEHIIGLKKQLERI